MNALTQEILAEIATQGPLSVARFMELALQHPTLGYYRAEDRLGADGDFITAPEISQMFGEMIGLWVAECWRQMGCPQAFVLLEMGAGRGTLMQDALRATRKIAGFHEALRLHFLETNATFRAAQQEKMAAFAPVFIDRLEALPPLPTLVVSNEFFDALPVMQLLESGSCRGERKLDAVEGRLVWRDDFGAAPPHDTEVRVREVSPLAQALMMQLATHIVTHRGAMLTVDYGYAESSGFSTLQAVSGHQKVDPLTRIGEVDLTTHVDFGALRQRAEGVGAKVWGPVGQGAFLLAMGIEIRLRLLQRAASPDQADALESGFRRLTEEAQMGTLFKVLAVASPDFSSVPALS